MGNILRSRKGVVPVAVIWALVILALGALIGVTAFLVSQAAVALLGIVALFLVVIYAVIPSLPAIARHIKAFAEAWRKEEFDDANDEEKPR